VVGEEQGAIVGELWTRLIKCSREFFFWTLTGNLLSGNVAGAYRLVEAKEAAFSLKSGVARHAPRQVKLEALLFEVTPIAPASKSRAGSWSISWREGVFFFNPPGRRPPILTQ
jgi:hypothetical protein